MTDTPRNVAPRERTLGTKVLTACAVAIAMLIAGIVVVGVAGPSALTAPRAWGASGSWACVTSDPMGHCPFGSDPQITGASSNPWVDNNEWSQISGQAQTLSANGPGDWQVAATVPINPSGSVTSYTNTGVELSGTVDSYSRITSGFTESMPHNSQTSGWGMYDNWFNNWSDEVMIQYDFTNNADCDPSSVTATNVTFGGSNGVPVQQWHLCDFGLDGSCPAPAGAANDCTVAWKLGATEGSKQSEGTGSIDVLAMTKWLETHTQPGLGTPYIPPQSTWTALSDGWEICSTGGQSETFTMSNYSVTASSSSGSGNTGSGGTGNTGSGSGNSGNTGSGSGGTGSTGTGGTGTGNPSPSRSAGYWLVGSDGGIFSFGGAPFYGSTGGMALQRPVVGVSPSDNDGGYWLVASDGGAFAFGNASFVGSIPGLGIHPAGSGLPNSLNAPIVGIVPSVTGRGYFMVASDGGVFAFGDARFEGSCPGTTGCTGTAVAVMPDASGKGYWLVTKEGGVYGFGDARSDGAPGHGLVTSASRTPDGRGYWIILRDGEVFAYGDAVNMGSPPSSNFNPLNFASAILATRDGGGYWLTSAQGKIFTFGDAPFDGDLAGKHLNGSIIAGVGY